MLGPLDCLLAVALIVSPDIEVSQEYSYLAPTLQAVAVGFEILDEREAKYLLKFDDNFASDMRLVRRRYEDLHDAPPVCDSIRFPDRLHVNEMLAFNRDYRNFLESQKVVNIGNLDELTQAQKETDFCYSVWDNIRDSRCEYYYVTVRRAALKTIKSKIGDANYYNGTYPPHIPIWRFSSFGN